MWAKNLRTETTGRTAKAVTEDDSDFMGNFEEELTDIAICLLVRLIAVLGMGVFGEHFTYGKSG
jgi:hypothetical protein